MKRIRMRRWIMTTTVGILGLVIGCESATPPPTAATPPTSPGPNMPPPSLGVTTRSETDPKVVVKGGSEYNFGTTELGQEFDHTFEIKNEGKSDLTLSPGQPSCSTCTSFVVDKQKLKPGEVALAKVKWHVTVENESFRQFAPITTNDPAVQELRLYVFGKIVKRIVLSPVDKWAMGEVIDGKTTEFAAKITSDVVDKFDIESITNSSKVLTITSTPMSPERLKELKTKSGYDLNAILTSEFPVGDFKDKVIFHLLAPNKLDISVNVEAKRNGPLEIFGPGWDSSRMALRLNSFDPKDDMSVKLTLFTRSIPDDVSITKVNCEDSRISVDLKADPRFKGKTLDHRRYDLVIKIAGSNREVVYTPQKPLIIELETDQPKVGKIRIKLLSHAIPLN